MFVTTNTTTGTVDATIPGSPPICSRSVGSRPLRGAVVPGCRSRRPGRTSRGSGVTAPGRSRSTGCRAPSGPPGGRSGPVPAWSGPARCPGSGDVPARSASPLRCRRTAPPPAWPRQSCGPYSTLRSRPRTVTSWPHAHSSARCAPERSASPERFSASSSSTSLVNRREACGGTCHRPWCPCLSRPAGRGLLLVEARNIPRIAARPGSMTGHVTHRPRSPSRSATHAPRQGAGDDRSMPPVAAVRQRSGLRRRPRPRGPRCRPTRCGGRASRTRSAAPARTPDRRGRRSGSGARRPASPGPLRAECAGRAQAPPPRGRRTPAAGGRARRVPDGGRARRAAPHG